MTPALGLGPTLPQGQAAALVSPSGKGKGKWPLLESQRESRWPLLKPLPAPVRTPREALGLGPSEGPRLRTQRGGPEAAGPSGRLWGLSPALGDASHQRDSVSLSASPRCLHSDLSDSPATRPAEAPDRSRPSAPGPRAPGGQWPQSACSRALVPDAGVQPAQALFWWGAVAGTGGSCVALQCLCHIFALTRFCGHLWTANSQGPPERGRGLRGVRAGLRGQRLPHLRLLYSEQRAKSQGRKKA